MKVIYNRWFPFGSFLAINICGMVICRGKKGCLSAVDRNHEYIHTLQQRELLFIGFYILYVLEWLYRSIRQHGFLKGYYAVSFEREAYLHQHDLNYASHRKHYAWIRG